MERETPGTSNVARANAHTAAPSREAPLSRAEKHALRRSAPLTPTQFKTLRRMAEQGISPLRHI